MNSFKGKDKLIRRANRRIYALLFALVTLVAALGVAVDAELRRTGEAIDLVYERHRLTLELEERFGAVVTNVRGYIAYGNDSFLQELEIERIRFESLLEETSGEAADRQAEEIASLWREYDRLIDVAIRYKAANDTAAVQKLSLEQTTPIIHQLERMFDEGVADREAELRALLGRNRQLNERLILGLLAFAVALFGLLAYTLHRFFRKAVVQPLSALEHAVDELGRGRTVRLPDDYLNDEIGALYRGFNFMIGELERRQDDLERSNEELSAQRDELEAQNEEILSQQEEQDRTLRLLTDRERDLELLSRYQERLAGFSDMEAFLSNSVDALLAALRLDAGLVVHRPDGGDAHLLHAAGYPSTMPAGRLEGLFGPAERALRQADITTVRRSANGGERGLHGGYEEAVDYYCPLLDDRKEPIGFLLLTGYGAEPKDPRYLKVMSAVVKQFALAFRAQLLYEDRRRQASELETLNAELEGEQQQLKAQRDLVAGIVESIQEGLVLCDYGIVRFANPKIESFFGGAAERGAAVEAFCERLERGSDGTLTGLHRRLRDLAAGDAKELYVRFSFKRDGGNGQARHYELYANLLESTVATRQLLLVFRDRTEEEKADVAKNEFVSIVSHELRTPLSSIMGFMEILLHREVAKERQRKYLETVYKESQRLSALIGDFLDLQRMEAGKQSYHFVPIAVEPWLRELVDGWKGGWPHRIELRVESEHPYVLGDADRLTQVMHNLISNAMKYSPGQDRVVVRLTSSAQRVRIDVTDFGLGIPEDAKPKLFTKFYRVDNSDRRQIGGTGLGLSIVKEIVEGHGGTFEFESDLGAGSTFSVSLPQYAVPSVAGKVVVIEDDPNVSGLISVAFEKLNLATASFATAEAAALALRWASGSERPALCIVDIQLAGRQSGWDFLEESKSIPALDGAPVVVMTVLEAPAGFRETPTRRFLRKPFTVERLLDVAKRCMNGEPV